MSQRLNPFAGRIQAAIAAVVVSIGLVASGCVHERTLDEAKVRDQGAPAYTGSVIIRPESMVYGRRSGNRGGFEAAYERYRGDDSQQVDLDHYLSLGKGEINGPQTAATHIKVDHGHVGYNHLFMFGRHFELEPMLGLSLDRMTVTAQGTAPGSRLLTEKAERWGALIAVTPRFNFNEYVGLEARLSGGVDFKSGGVVSGVFSVVARPGAGVTLKAGHYSRSQEFNSTGGVSDLDTGLSGFMGALTFDFR
ncbi:MAG TPA: hypothetical protein VK629_01165 [Steroidobacteraceae bacterium]|nr:hypothetical protein [Steroidobacteraceae bacterium]